MIREPRPISTACVDFAGLLSLPHRRRMRMEQEGLSVKKPQEKSAIDMYFDRRDRLNREIPELPIIIKLCLFFEIEPEELKKELKMLLEV